MNANALLSDLAALLLLLSGDALLTLSNASIIHSREEHVAENSEHGNRRLQLTYVLVVTLLRLSAAAVAVQALAVPLAATWPATPTWVAYAVVLVPVGIVMLVFGDVVPTAVGSTHAERIVGLAKWPMVVLVHLLRPLVAGLYRLSFWVSALFRSSASTAVTLSEEELLTLIDADATLEEEERDMLRGVLSLNEVTARELMTPRIDIVAVPLGAPLAEARALFLGSGHSRLPIYEGSLDQVRGILYAKDLLAVWHNGHSTVQRVDEILRPAHFVPESLRGDALLHAFQQHKVHLLMVMDEYGGTAGLVTIENLLEEIVGDIFDEYDTDEKAEYELLTANVWHMDAGIDLDDFNGLVDTTLDTEVSDTLGGYIYSQLGRVPAEGETIATATLLLRVEKVEGRRIRQVYVERLTPTTDTDTPDVPASVTATGEIPVVAADVTAPPPTTDTPAVQPVASSGAAASRP